MSQIARAVAALLFLGLVSTAIGSGDPDVVTLKVSAVATTFNKHITAVYTAKEGLTIVAIGTRRHDGESIAIVVPSAREGTFDAAVNSGLSMNYSRSIYSSNSRDHFAALGAEMGTEFKVTISKFGDVGEAVEGSFSGVVKSGAVESRLAITEGRFSVIRQRPKTKPE